MMINEYPTRDVQSPPSGSGIGLPDIYFILFRRKWVVLTGLVMGLVAAALVWKLKQPQYQSQAKLLVKYVLEVRAPTGPGSESQVRAPESGFGAIINSEMEILKSLDVATEAAAALTPDKNLPPDSKTQSKDQASAAVTAGTIMGGLRVDNPNRGNIIWIKFEHPDPAMAQRVLEQVIESYLKKHQEVHRANGEFDDVFVQQRDQLRAELAQTEERLKQLKAKAGVVSLEEARKTQFQQTATLHQELFKVEAELAQHNAVLDELRKSGPTPEIPIATAAPVAQPIIDEYRRINSQVEYFEQRERSLLNFTLDYPPAKTNRFQLEEARRQKTKLEKDNPGLLHLPAAAVASIRGAPIAGIPGPDAASLASLVRSFEAKRTFLTNQLAAVRAEANIVDQTESEIIELQRRREFLESQYSYVQRNLHQTKFDRELGSQRGANISRVQAPSPPFRDFKDVQKKTGMAFFAIFAAGLAVAFLLEFVFDRTLKRAKDVEALDAPHFLSIPNLRFSRTTTRVLSNGTPTAKPDANQSTAPSGALLEALREREEGLKPFHESLRDRLVNYFDIRQMTHKPKLIAVTSCNEGAGVTSIANGLAASLSETGDGNVLLVNMRGNRGVAHAFCNGKPTCGLAEALDDETRNTALVHENLYVVSADTIDRDLQRIVPRQFSHFVPKLKASDYDYIIFDMPPVGQTSITSKVARFMDMVLMVIESNKTDRDVARRAWALLSESKANVATVLNKQRRYVPAWLQPDFH